MFVTISTILFFLLGLVWTRKDWINFMIKAVFFAMFVYGLVLSLAAHGVILSPNGSFF